MPNAGDAFLTGALPLSHSPLDRIDYRTNGPTLDLQAFIDAVTNFLDETIFPIIQNITGLDLSSPENFIISIATMIFNGGNAVLSLVNALMTPIFDVIRQITGVDLRTVFQGLNLGDPGSMLTSMLDTIKGAIQPLIDALAGALAGTASTLNDITAIAGAFFNPMQLLQNLFGLVQSVATQLGGAAGGLDSRIAALEAAALGASGLVSADNFNRALIGANWTNVSGALAVQGNDFVRTAGLSAGYYNAGSPTTDKHGATVRLTSKLAGECRVFICSDTTMSNFAAVNIHTDIFGNDYMQLVTGSSPSVVVAHTQVNFSANLFANTSLQEGDVITIRYDDTANTFYVLRNNAIIPQLTWTDTTNIVTHGSTKRRVGIVSNALDQWQFPGFGITDFVYYDWMT
jgi:hypothetical protein